MARALDGWTAAAFRGRSRLGIAWVIGPVVLLAALAVLTADQDTSKGLPALLALVVLPLVAREAAPLPVLVVIGAGSLLSSGSSDGPWVQVLATALASYTVGERALDRTRSALCVIVVAAALSIGFLALEADPLLAIALPFVVLVPSFLLGDVVRGRREESLRRAEAIERAQREREERLRAAAAEERRHVARELHDVVAHAVSVMVIQAGAARQVLRTSPDEAEASILAVESTGRQAMTELRRFLGALDDDADETAGTAPQPGIGELPSLVDRVREAGLPASLEVAGSPRPVPASLDVTVYRIVQEALTNALRYARQAATLVRLSWEPGQLRVEILDDGPAAAAAGAGAGTGRGLAGMHERAALAGGRLEAGPRLGGGYAVRAWLPLGPAPTTDG
jgi:signal transduction histidine kinase